MYTDGPGNRRFRRSIGVGRDAAGKATTVSPTEATGASGAATDSGGDDTETERQGRRQEAAQRFELSSATRQTLLQAVDAQSGQVLWQIPGAAVGDLYRQIRQAAAQPGPASFAPEVAQTLARESGDDTHARGLGTRAYAAEEPEPPEGGEFSRKV